MSSSSLTLSRIDWPRFPSRALVTRTVPVASLDPATRQAAFALFAATYENASHERFERDLDEKQHVILLFDRESGALKGFSTVLVRDVQSACGPATLVFSGDTVIDRQYWGQKRLQLAFLRVLVSLKLRAPTQPLYWFLLSKGYRTYLLLANAFPHAVPRADTNDDPALRAMLDRFAAERFGAEYDWTRGLVRYATPHERVREGIAPVTPDVMANPQVRFFVERNPEHLAGVELACLADVRLRDLACVAVRIALARLRRVARSAGTAT
jgi:hypothetical protein